MITEFTQMGILQFSTFPQQKSLRVMNRICKCIATDFIDLVLDLTMIFMSSIHAYAFQIPHGKQV